MWVELVPALGTVRRFLRLDVFTMLTVRTVDSRWWIGDGSLENRLVVSYESQAEAEGALLGLIVEAGLKQP